MVGNASALCRRSTAWRSLWSLGAALLLAAPASARAERLCDSDWPTGNLVIDIGQRKNDGTPVQPYDPLRPEAPYELAGNRYLFRDKGKVYKVLGRFQDRKEGEAALKRVLTERTSLWTNAYPPFLSSPGAYLVNETRTCKITRKNPVIDPSAWILEKDDVLLVGTDASCAHGHITKTVTAVSCDGTKNLVTDSITAPCEAERINTCVHAVAPGVFLFEHLYTVPGNGTELRLRLYDVRKKKRLQAFESTHDGGGPDVEMMRVDDVDKDGVPEIVILPAGEQAPKKILKWRKDRFSEVKP